MAGTVVPAVSWFVGATGGNSDCDSITDWSTATLDNETFIQGTGALSAKVSKTVFTSVFTLQSEIDLSDTLIFVWMNCATPNLLDTKDGADGQGVGGGLRIRVEDGSANWGEWNVAGKDTYFGGWECFVVRTTTTFDQKSATTPTMTAITKVGIVCETTASVAKTNFWWDAVRYGTGLRIKAGTEADPAKFQDILDAESNVSNQWGVVSVREGVIMVQGKLWIGSTTSGEATYFKDTNKVIIFRDRAFGVFYELKIEGNAGATTKVYFGTKSGERGISGCIFRSAGASKFKFTATDTNITDLGLYGCSFFDADTISLPTYSTTREVPSSSFEESAEILPDTCIVKYCNVVKADNIGIRMASTAHYITDSNFISNPRAVRIPNSGTYTFDALIFSGNTYDIYNTSGGIVTINCVNGSNPSSTLNEPVTGTIDIINTVYLTVDVKNISGTMISDASVYIEDAASTAVLMNELTDANGRAQETYNYTGTVDINVRIRKSSPTTTRYVPVDTSGVITSGGFALSVVMREDEIAT